MKKIFYALLFVLIICFCNIISSFAAEEPFYDSTYNDSKGAFFANGTDISINKDLNNNTIISWNGGNQIVPDTVTVFGGGNGNLTFEKSNIIMNDGTVFNIVGGGLSINAEQNSNVGKVNVTINGGYIQNNLVGGGYLYTKVDDANLKINGGKIGNVIGGGFASVTIDGINYQSGILYDEINSGTRVEKVNISVNNAKIENTLFGGGQGYSYTGDTKINIYESDLSSSYVTIGGSNGYTRSGILDIQNGKINIVQSVNRGILENAKFLMTGGTVNEFYIGGETEDISVSGIVSKVDTELLGGTINNLNAGKSNSIPLVIDNNYYKVLVAKEDINIINNRISNGVIDILYDVHIYPSEIKINEGDLKIINAEIITIPEGYEYLFEDNIKFSTDNEKIAIIDDRGIVTGVREGSTIISANLNAKTDYSTISVENNNLFNIMLISIIRIIYILLLIVIIIYFIIAIKFKKCRFLK